ncbi:myelin protein zero-like protein 2 isoform X2 [Thamnophis elegans]|uniref:myelin protein zero-like protein 2 isoform X2 n=1 Tax=Thamnophis elegans TaxID=35005 RepID=UPI001376E99E|nr:myelin protein zero-like protein 2 isoform X2 [Thamnophis elegans]
MGSTGSPRRSPCRAASRRTPILDPDGGPVEGRSAAWALPESPPGGRPCSGCGPRPGRHARDCRQRGRRHLADEFLHFEAAPCSAAAAPFPAAEFGLALSTQIGQRPPPGSAAALRFLLQGASGPCSGNPFLLLSAALGPVAAMETFTPGTLEALNGTDVRLKCTFRSPEPVGPKLAVSWYFQSEPKEPLEMQAYPSNSARFLGRITWDGNVHRDDASVMLHNVSTKDNGTFQCHVKNPPDVDGVVGEIQLSVVLKRSFSEVHILVLTIGISCAAMVILVVVVVIWRHWRRTQQDKTREVGRPEELKLKEGGEENEAPLPGEGTHRS